MLTSQNLAQELGNVVGATESTELIIHITQGLRLLVRPGACLQLFKHSQIPRLSLVYNGGSLSCGYRRG